MSALSNSAEPSAIKTLEGKEDRYNGIIIKDDLLPDCVDEFVSRLKYSLIVWKQSRKRGIWLKLPITKASFVEPAVSLGFVYHSAEKQYLVLTKWLSEGPNSLPHNATHQVGVGCVVINSKGKMLLVQEKSGILKGLGIWKFPTGLADHGEDISQAAVREVLEETGVKVRFSHILSFRQIHNLFLGKSDLFFVCVLELEDESCDTITAQESEIEVSEWLDPEVYFNQAFMLSSEAHRQLNLTVESWLKTRKYYGGKHAESNENAGSDTPVIVCNYYPSGFRPGDSAVYTIV